LSCSFDDPLWKCDILVHHTHITLMRNEHMLPFQLPRAPRLQLKVTYVRLPKATYLRSG